MRPGVTRERARVLAGGIALLGGLVLFAMAPAQAAAQAAAQTTEPRETQPGYYEHCVRMAQALVNGRDDQDWKTALRSAQSCDVTGHIMFANAWRRAKDSAAAEDLFRAMERYRDARVIPAIIRVAEDEAAPRWQRLYAMHALLKHLRPRFDYEPVGGMGVAMADLYAPALAPIGAAGWDTLARPISRALLRTAGRTRDPAVRSTARGLGIVAHVDAIAGGAPDTLAKQLLAAIPAPHDCRPVLAGLLQARKNARWDRAVAELGRCPEIAAEGLGRAWREVGEDTTLLRELSDVGRRYPDGRLYATLAEIAAAWEVGPLRRTAALQVLASYRVWGRTPELIEPWQPLPIDHGSRTMALLERIIANDPAPEVRAAARTLERRLRPR